MSYGKCLNCEYCRISHLSILLEDEGENGEKIIVKAETEDAIGMQVLDAYSDWTVATCQCACFRKPIAKEGGIPFASLDGKLVCNGQLGCVLFKQVFGANYTKINNETFLGC